MIIIASLILKNKYSWNTCALVFHSSEKFDAFKEVLHSLSLERLQQDKEMITQQDVC